MKAIALVFLLLFFSSFTHGEKGDPREIEAKLARATDADRLPFLVELSRMYLFRDPGKTLEYGREAEAILSRFPDDKTQLMILDLVCQAHIHLGRYDPAGEYAEKSLVLSQKMAYARGSAVARNILSVIANQKGDYARSREHAASAIELFRKEGDKKALASSLNNMGISYDMQGDYDKALEYYLQSLALKEEIGDKESVARSLNNIGVIQSILGRNDEALSHYSRALQIKEELGDRVGIAAQYINIGNIYGEGKQDPRALDYYQKALSLYRELDNQGGVASALYNIGLQESLAGNVRQAQAYLQQSLNLRQNMGEKESVAQTLIQLGKVYIKLKRNDLALQTLEQAMTLAEEIGALTHQQESALALSELYEERQNFYRALRYYKEYKNRGDQIFNAQSSRKIAEMQARYENDKKEQEILLLKKNAEIQALRLNRQKMLQNLMFAAFVLFASSILFLGYRYRYVFVFWKKKNHIGHYRIIEQMGSGGMGTVYRAHDVLDNSGRKTIAIKVLREEYFADETQKKRFRQEASLIDQLVHPNIVRVIERGETDNGLYIAMEVLEGPSLSDVIQGGHGVDADMAPEIMLQIADALKSIHAMDIVHRDLKPDNIKLVNEGGTTHFVKLMDFGLAITRHMSRLTETGIVVGTLFYLSPEQISGEPITPASDIHSLGVICYEMLTGKKPFVGETTLDVMKQIMSVDPIDLAVFLPDLDRNLSALIMMMLQKNPRHRPTAAMVVDVLKSTRKAQKHG